MNEVELRKEIAKVTWWHRIDLGHGVVTPGVDDTHEKLRTLVLSEDLIGMTMLDFGAYDDLQCLPLSGNPDDPAAKPKQGHSALVHSPLTFDRP